MMPGFLGSIANVFHRDRPKPSDYYYHVAQRPHSRHLESVLQLSDAESLNEGEPPTYSALPYNVFGTNVKHRQPIPVWPEDAQEGEASYNPSTMSYPGSSEAEEYQVNASTEAVLEPVQTAWKGPRRRVLKKQRRFKIHEKLGFNPFGSDVGSRLSQLDLPLSPLYLYQGRAIQNGVEFKSFPDVAYGGESDPGSINTAYLDTPLSVATETGWTPLFDSPLSIATTVTDCQPLPLPPKGLLFEEGEKCVEDKKTTASRRCDVKDTVHLKPLKKGAIMFEGEARSDTSGSLEESVVFAAARVGLKVDAPRVRLVKDVVASGPSFGRLVDEPVDADTHGNQSCSDEADEELRALLAHGAGQDRRYPSVPSSSCFPCDDSFRSISFPSLYSVRFPTFDLPPLTGIANDTAPPANPRDKRTPARSARSQRTTIPFPRLPDAEVPYKPGWIYHYSQGAYASIPSSIPLEERQVCADGCVEIYEAAAPLLDGQIPTTEEWDRLLEALDIDPFNWIQRPPVTGFRFLSELEVDMMLEFRGTPINSLLAIFYGVHVWTRGELGAAENLAAFLAEAFPRLGWHFGLPRRFIQYLYECGLEVRISPDGVELLEVLPDTL